MSPFSPQSPPGTPDERQRAIRIIARSLFRELHSSGYTPSHVINLTAELLELLTDSMRNPAADSANHAAT